MSYNENEIEFCEFCGCGDFTENPIDHIEQVVCEFDLLCDNCGERVNYWEYGYYQNDMSTKYLKLKQNRNRKLKLNKIMKNNNKI